MYALSSLVPIAPRLGLKACTGCHLPSFQKPRGPLNGMKRYKLQQYSFFPFLSAHHRFRATRTTSWSCNHLVSLICRIPNLHQPTVHRVQWTERSKAITGRQQCAVRHCEIDQNWRLLWRKKAIFQLENLCIYRARNEGAPIEYLRKRSGMSDS